MSGRGKRRAGGAPVGAGGGPGGSDGGPDRAGYDPGGGPDVGDGGPVGFGGGPGGSRRPGLGRNRALTEVQIRDIIARQIDEDSDGDDVLDLNGELAGWVQDEFESEDDEDEVHVGDNDGDEVHDGEDVGDHAHLPYFHHQNLH